MNCIFKHALTGVKFTTTIGTKIRLNELKEILNSFVSTTMNITDNNYEIIIAGLEKKEMAEPINLNSNEMFYSIREKAFYIRPINYSSCTRTNVECAICTNSTICTNGVLNVDSISDNWTSCTHYNVCCAQCISSWIRTCQNMEKEPNCPICRKNIQK